MFLSRPISINTTQTSTLVVCLLLMYWKPLKRKSFHCKCTLCVHLSPFLLLLLFVLFCCFFGSILQNFISLFFFAEQIKWYKLEWVLSLAPFHYIIISYEILNNIFVSTLFLKKLKPTPTPFFLLRLYSFFF